MRYCTCKILLFFSFLPALLFAQTSRIDSLTNALAATGDKKVQADLLHELASETWDYDFDKAFRYANESLQISERIRYQKGIAQTLTDAGLYYYFKGDYKNSEAFLRRAIREADHNYGDFPAYAYMHLGNIYRSKANFDSAFWYYEKAIALSANPRSPAAQSLILYNIGLLYYNFSGFAQAMNYWQRALLLRQKLGDPIALAESWKSIGMVYKAFGKIDSATYYFSKVNAVAMRENNPELKIFYALNTGEISFQLGDIKNAVIAYAKALELLEKHDYKSYHAVVLKRVGEVYEAQGSFQRAVEYFLNALRINEQLQNKQEEGWTLGLIGRMYMHQGLDLVANQYAKHALSILTEIHDKAGVAFAHSILGRIAFHQRDFDDALVHYKVALQLREQMGYQNNLADVVYDVARVYEEQGFYERSMRYQRRVLEYYKAGGDKAKQITVLNTLALLSSNLHHWAEATSYLKQSAALVETISNPLLEREMYKTYARLYKAKGDLAKALEYYDLYESLNDTIFSNESAMRIAELNALYHLEKKESEIRELNSQNTQKKDLILLQQSKIRQQNIVLIASILCGMLLLVVAIVLYWYYRTKSKAHKQLRRFNREISEKNEEIQAQSEELMEANSALVELNHELIEKREEIEAQSEELREANETIHEINRGLETMINKRTSQLKDAYKELDTFFYRSSHDFRRPLTTFMGLAEVAKITVKDKNALELFDKVNETARNLDKMLIKLQSISDVGAQQLVFKDVLFKEIFESVYDSFREEIQKKNIRVECDVTLRDSFISYPAMIKIIIENLLENSINFSGIVDPYIRFKVYQVDGYVTLEVQDNGQGIPTEYQERIFEMYFRGNERSKGNGLGLYIVQKAVEKLDGIIRMESVSNKGTTFYVDLPFR